MEIEVRRIQRVGSSSLVVTLPKEWARRLNLAPGSKVMLIDEGDSIRIKPVDGEGNAAVTLDLSKVPESLAANAPTCIYLSSLSDVEVVFPSRKSLEEGKRRSLHMMGLQIFEEPDGEKAYVEVLLDSSRIDISKLLKSLTVSVSESAELLVSVLRGGGDGIRERVEDVRTQFLRTHYIVLRYLAARYSEEGGLENYQAAVSTSYAGFAIDLLQELALTAARIIGNGLPASDVERLVEIIRGIEKSGDILFRTLASPSVKRLAELYGTLHSTRVQAEEAIMALESRAAAVVAGKLHDIVRLMMLSSYVAVCLVIMKSSLLAEKGT